jgi:hypothetical protein
MKYYFSICLKWLRITNHSQDSQCPCTDLSSIHVMHQPTQCHFVFPCPSHSSWFNHISIQAKSTNYSADCYVNFSIPLFLPLHRSIYFYQHYVFRHDFCLRFKIILWCHAVLLGDKYLNFEGSFCLIFRVKKSKADPQTQCNVPEDLNFSNTAVRTSNLTQTPFFHLGGRPGYIPILKYQPQT